MLFLLLLFQLNEVFVIPSKEKLHTPLFALKKEDKISPMLVQWANKDNPSTETRLKQPKKKSIRREKQVQRKEEETLRLKQELTLIRQLRMLLGDTQDKQTISFSTSDILSLVNQLVENNDCSNLRTIAASSNQYRMLWAGSDAAIYHIGSGLHKVPLARLQEVFLSFFKSTIEVYEVIRVIGPFLNVKNILKDHITYKNNTITYTSMIDGTGKEVLAGKEQNQKIVPLKVILATENIIVWKNPDSTAENGQDLLIFIREYDMDARLDILRVL